jgi:hypothetical protein
MMKYFKRRWEENRGDQHDDWGCSWWFFEIDDGGNVLRQIEEYDRGPKKRYSEENPEDLDGGLSEKPLDLLEFKPYYITKEEFEAEWK